MAPSRGTCRARSSNFAAGLCGAIAFFGVTPAHAEEPEIPLRVDYRAPDGCPHETDFFSAVRARAPRARSEPATREGPMLVVSITNGDGESTGYLTFRGADGLETERRVSGDTCGEVVSALALIAAIAVDPDAASRSPEPASSAGPASVPPVTSAPPIAPPSPAPGQPHEAAPATSPDTVVRAARSNPHSWHFAVEVAASLAFGVTPNALFVTPVALEVVPPTWGPLSPVARVRFEHASTSAPQTSGPAGTFSWTAGVLELCPNRWKTGNFALDACGLFEGGVLDASGVNVVPTRDTAQGWFAVGGLGRIEWRFFDPVFAAIEGGARFALNRPTYFFQPDLMYYQPPLIGGFGGVGLGAQFL